MHCNQSDLTNEKRVNTSQYNETLATGPGQSIWSRYEQARTQRTLFFDLQYQIYFLEF